MTTPQPDTPLAAGRLKLIPIDQLQPHPNNPRLFLREEVVNAICEQIKTAGRFDQAHAPLVRPFEDAYQIVSGHQRIEAAKRAGLEAVPCLVRDMTDEEAFREVLFQNAQAELKPLEIGLHVLTAAGKGKRGRGNKGGIAEYARMMGFSEPTLRGWVHAAEVAKIHDQSWNLLVDYTTCLSVIHRAAPEDWPALVESMLKGQWSKEMTEARVEATKTKRQRESPINRWKAIDAWNRGDWRNYVSGLPDGSISLLLTDPPRADALGDCKGVAELSACLAAVHPKLAVDAHVLCFCHSHNMCEVRAAFEDAGFELRGVLLWIWAKDVHGLYDPQGEIGSPCEFMIHAVKGSPILFEPQDDVLFADCATNHPFEKPVALLERLIEVSTVEGELVADPFAGLASTLVAAKKIDRRYWGCEIDTARFIAGSARLAAVRQEAASKGAA